ETEESRVVLVPIEVGAIDLRGDAANAAIVAKGGEAGALGVGEEGIFLAQPFFQVEVEGPDEHRIVAIDVIDDVEERAQIPPQRDFANFDGHIGYPCLARVPSRRQIRSLRANPYEHDPDGDESTATATATVAGNRARDPTATATPTRSPTRTPTP